MSGASPPARIEVAREAIGSANTKPPACVVDRRARGAHGLWSPVAIGRLRGPRSWGACSASVEVCLDENEERQGMQEREDLTATTVIDHNLDLCLSSGHGCARRTNLGIRDRSHSARRPGRWISCACGTEHERGRSSKEPPCAVAFSVNRRCGVAAHVRCRLPVGVALAALRPPGGPRPHLRGRYAAANGQPFNTSAGRRPLGHLLMNW